MHLYFTITHGNILIYHENCQVQFFISHLSRPVDYDVPKQHPETGTLYTCTICGEHEI